MDDCDQITINIVPDQSVDINAITLNQGIINHSVTHQSGGSDELLHNLLGGLQGGSGNQYYHLSSEQYNNLTTGDVVRPSETGVFYTNDNLSGFITGVDLSTYATINYVSGVSGDIQSQINNLNNSTGSYVLDSETGIFYLASNPSGYITGVDLSSYSTIVYVTGISGSLQDQIIILNNQTGSYITGSVVRPNETGIFITNPQTGQFYGSNNPSGFITGVDLSSYAVIEFTTGISGQLQTQITTLDNQTGSYYPRTNPSGYITKINDLLYTTGDQIKSGRLIIGNDQNSIVDPNSPYTLSIQTNSPATWLEILNNSGTNKGVFFGIQDNNFEQYNWQGGDIKFFTSENPSDGIERLIIKNDGKIGIGINSPSEILEVIGNIKSNTAIFDNRPTVNGTGVLLSGEAYSINNPSGYITGVDLSFSGNYYTKDESESRYVNTTGTETILGDKTFHDKVYINNLYVTGLETIVNTTNTNVASNYIMLNLTGGAVDGGLFFVTGSGLTGINDSGAIIGFDHSDKFKFGIGTRASDLSTLSTIASFEEVTGISGDLQTQISTLNNQTGDYVLKIESGQFYPVSNPSGYITGIDLSSYVLNSETGNFITNSQTGEFYSNSNPSGFITGINNLVYTTGDQIISGSKTFDFRPNVNGTGILLSGEAAQLPETIIYSTGDQNISGIKTFNDLPNIPITPISGNNPTSKEYVDTLISGVNLSIQDYLLSVTTNSLSSFTLASGDNNKVIQCTSTTDITVTLPDSLQQGFNCVLIQSNIGQINIQAGTGVSLGSFGNLVKTAGQHAPVSIVCLASGIYNIAGNLI